MRTAFIQELILQARLHPDLFLVVGDLGFSVVEPFATEFPDRFLNAGVAEQNMTGVAAGLASEGYHAVTYSIANFPTIRCLEQIRNDICYHNLRVTVVAVGGGLSYGNLGYSHHGVEDLAIMRTLPNMTVVAPGDPVEARLATRALMDWSGPSYLRLGKAGEPVVHLTEPEFSIGKAVLLQDGSDITLVSMGGILDEVVKAARQLAEQGRSARVLSMPSLRPWDSAAILSAAERTGKILTVEEHGIGGLGSAVAETLAAAAKPIKLRCLRTGAAAEEAGSQAFLRGRQGLSSASIAKAALEMFCDP